MTPQPSHLTSPSRRLVFISHANPEQNDFALWLGVQLASAGYEVWSDVTKLIGGEVFWDDIEDAIRHHSAKFVLVVSAAALQKDGVKDEIHVGVTVERSQKIDRFVVPVRIDDVPFTDFNANIARKSTINFTASWSVGLANLFEVFDRDGVPRGNVTPLDVRAWCDNRLSADTKPRFEREALTSNWLPITKLPSEVSLFSVGVEEKRVRGVMGGSRLPWFPYFRLVGTFGTKIDLMNDLGAEQIVERQYQIETERFLRGRTQEMPSVQRNDARRLTVSLLRQGWDRLMEAKGLCPYEMSSGIIAWYFPKDLVPKNKVDFVDYEGRRRKKSVVGRSEKRNVYWHLGFVAKPVVGDASHYVLRAAVVFSEDGLKPIDSAEKMHRLRRGFCRNWWNDQWRDLLLAYVYSISKGSETFNVPFGDFAGATVSAALTEFSSPVSCSDPAPKTRTAPLIEEDETPPEAPVEADEDFGAIELEEVGDD